MHCSLLSMFVGTEKSCGRKKKFSAPCVAPQLNSNRTFTSLISKSGVSLTLSACQRAQTTCSQNFSRHRSATLLPPAPMHDHSPLPLPGTQAMPPRGLWSRPWCTEVAQWLQQPKFSGGRRQIAWARSRRHLSRTLYLCLLSR